MPRLAVFRTDASPSKGSGHVRRCLVLQDQLSRAGWVTAFAGIPETPDTVPAIRGDKAFKAISGSGEEVAASLRETWPRGVDLLVVDSYELDATFESACRPWARKIMVIDDLANRAHDCDLLLDANHGRRPSDYSGLVPTSSRLLIGLRYCLLRPEFRARRPRSLIRGRSRSAVGRVFVSFGGTDATNATPLALKALASAGYRGDVEVVLGAAAPNLAAVRRLLPQLPYRVRLHIDCDQVAAVMADCDFAIGAGGTMTWERFCLGLPSVIVPVAENQLPAARALAREGLAVVTAPFRDLRHGDLAPLVTIAMNAHKLRRLLRERNARYVDGAGAIRVAAEVEQLLHGRAPQVTMGPED